MPENLMEGWLGTSEAAEKYGRYPGYWAQVAPVLGGKKWAGRWLIPEDRVKEHFEAKPQDGEATTAPKGESEEGEEPKEEQ